MVGLYINDSLEERFDYENNAEDYVESVFADHVTGVWGHMTEREAIELECESKLALQDLKEKGECVFWGDTYKIKEEDDDDE